MARRVLYRIVPFSMETNKDLNYTVLQRSLPNLCYHCNQKLTWFYNTLVPGETILNSCCVGYYELP